MRRLFIVIAFLFLTSFVWAAEQVPLQFFSYSQMKLSEQDVFVERAENPQQVVRLEAKEIESTTTSKKFLFTAAASTDHDLFTVGSTPLGPFPKGKALGVMLDQWLSASGSGTYSPDVDTQAQFDFTFQNLIPNSMYSVSCSRLPLLSNATVGEVPCDDGDWSDHRFTSGAKGNGTIFFRLTSPIPESTKETATVISLIYHSDRKIHEGKLGDFGLNSHVQLISILPAKEVVTEPVKEFEVAPQGTRWWLIIGGFLLVGLGAWWVGKRTLTDMAEKQKEE